jgi:D-glycero-D-manno-heptose 1,7-bisphosphate phosphatase
MKKAVFLDRDGVINEKAPEGLYITKWEEFNVLAGVPEAIALLNQAGYCVIIVTNQRCIAKGLMTVADLEKMHEYMADRIGRSGAIIDGIYYCPHEPGTCACRKPAPGMLLEAAHAHKIDIPASWMIGDSDIDVEAGKNAGCRTARVLASDKVSGETRIRLVPAEIVASSLLEAVREILLWEATSAARSQTTLENESPNRQHQREANTCR